MIHNLESEKLLYINTKEIAGLRFNPSNVKWASANGFKTNKGNLEILENIASNKNMTKAMVIWINFECICCVADITVMTIIYKLFCLCILWLVHVTTGF